MCRVTATKDPEAAKKPEAPSSKESQPQKADEAAKGAAAKPSGGNVFSLGDIRNDTWYQSAWVQGRLFHHGCITVAVVGSGRLYAVSKIEKLPDFGIIWW